MNTRIGITALVFFILTSCHHRDPQHDNIVEPTPVQQKMLDAGWTLETPDEDLTEIMV